MENQASSMTTSIEPYPHGWQVWSEGMKKFLMTKNIQPQFIYSGEVDDIAHYKKYLGAEVVLIDPERTYYEY